MGQETELNAIPKYHNTPTTHFHYQATLPHKVHVIPLKLPTTPSAPSHFTLHTSHPHSSLLTSKVLSQISCVVEYHSNQFLWREKCLTAGRVRDNYCSTRRGEVKVIVGIERNENKVYLSC